MTAAAFQKAVLFGMAASPFAGTLSYIRGTTIISLTGCLINEDTNTLEVTETGALPEHVLDVHIPKSALTFRPDQELDRLRYAGRLYRFRLESGDSAASPVWCLHARSPLK